MNYLVIKSWARLLECDAEVMPNTEVKIVDRATGETVESGEQGERYTRGYLVMKGYDDEPEATTSTIDRE